MKRIGTENDKKKSAIFHGMNTGIEPKTVMFKRMKIGIELKLYFYFQKFSLGKFNYLKLLIIKQ